LLTSFHGWWRDALPTAHSFVILPLTVNRHPAGFIYGDWDTPRAVDGININTAELMQLNELRAVLVSAIEQHYQQNSTLLI